MRNMLKEYTLIRAQIYQGQESLPTEHKLTQDNDKLQKQIWELAVSDCGKSDSRTCDMLMLPALGEVFSVATLRQAALLNHPPLVVYIMLVIISLFGALLVGYASPVSKKRNFLYMLTYALTISVLITLIVDMEFPRTGLIRVNSADKIILDLGNSM